MSFISLNIYLSLLLTALCGAAHGDDLIEIVEEPTENSAPVNDHQRFLDLSYEWFAEHQDSTGYWDAQLYGGRSGDLLAPTALITLSFLNAGHSEMAGKYKKSVRKGVRYINSRLPTVWESTFQAAIVAIALAETSIFGSSPLTKANADKIFLSRIFPALEEIIAKEKWSRQDHFDLGWIIYAMRDGKTAELPSFKKPEAKILYQKFVERESKFLEGRRYVSFDNLLIDHQSTWIHKDISMFIGLNRKKKHEDFGVEAFKAYSKHLHVHQPIDCSEIFFAGVIQDQQRVFHRKFAALSISQINHSSFTPDLLLTRQFKSSEDDFILQEYGPLGKWAIWVSASCFVYVCYY